MSSGGTESRSPTFAEGLPETKAGLGCYTSATPIPPEFECPQETLEYICDIDIRGKPLVGLMIENVIANPVDVNWRIEAQVGGGHWFLIETGSVAPGAFPVPHARWVIAHRARLGLICAEADPFDIRAVLTATATG